MKDYLASVESLKREAAEAGLIRDLATDPIKRQIYSRLHGQLSQSLVELQQAINEPLLAGLNPSQPLPTQDDGRS